MPALHAQRRLGLGLTRKTGLSLLMSHASLHRRTYGQYFTPAAVVRCCYDLLAGVLPARPQIADPACGDGAFLLGAQACGLAAPAQLSGCELDPALVALLHTRGLAGVRLADGLDPAALPAAAFDLVAGNPPFGVATSGRGRAELASEVRFLLRALELARPGGLVALVLPNGVLANERLHALRADLLVRCTLLAAIALPRQAFRHAGTSAQCSLLVLRNAAAPAGHQAFFALPEQIDALPATAAAYHAGPPAGPACTITSLQPGTPEHYWLPQSIGLARRMDAQFWRPEQRALIERMAARWPLRRLAELVEGRRGLIAGDHVRPSRGEARGPGLPYEYYQTREFLAAGYNYAQIEHCDARAYARLRHTAVQRHDILVSCAGVGGAGRGRVCLVTHTPGQSCTGDVLIVRARQIDPVVLFLLLSTQAGRMQLLRLQNGVGTVNLSVNELSQVVLPLLPPAIQRDLAQRYVPVAAAHAAAMAALQRGDQPQFERVRAECAGLLAALVREAELLVLGPDHSEAS